MKIKIFRWKAIGPLLLVFLLLGTSWLIFGDRLIEDTGEEITTELLGTQVDIRGLRLRETEARVVIAGLEIADPFRLDRNLLETGTAILNLDPAALLEKKLVIDLLTIENLRFGTARTTPARPVSGGGFAPNLLRQVRQWSSQFNVPLLSLTPIDTIKALVLDPTQLSTIKSAEAVVATADSVTSAFAQAVTSLNLRAPVDSARALAERLANATPARLGLAGTREAVQAVRRTLQEVDQARERVRALEQSVDRGVSEVGTGISRLDEARQIDYRFARSLLQLPSFSAPDIGAALFGRVSIDRFEQAVYWAELAQRHLPPGLRPATRPAAKRLRMDGTTVRFPRERAYPSFLLRDGTIDVAFTAFGGSHTLKATAAGITTEPAVHGAPAVVSSHARIGGDHPVRIAAGALIDHRTSPVHDSVRLQFSGVPLPSLDLPGLPFQLEPGAGSSALVFNLRGKQVAAQWSLRTSEAVWNIDSSRTGNLGTVETLIWRVLSGLRSLEVTAELSGTLQAPQFKVRSNIDQAIADRVRGLMGEELRAAEARVRAEVDRLVGAKVAEVKAEGDRVATELRAQVASIKGDLEIARAQLEARLKALSGLGGVIGM